MATNELIAKLNELSELRRMAEELNAEIEGVQDAIKAHMTEADTDTITAGAFRVTWKAVTSTRIDTAALRKELPEVWQEYGKTTTTRRFSVTMAKQKPEELSHYSPAMPPEAQPRTTGSTFLFYHMNGSPATGRSKRIFTKKSPVESSSRWSRAKFLGASLGLQAGAASATQPASRTAY